MKDNIKQRILGMLIVVVAGVVFIPDLLDGKKQNTKADFKKIPDKPAFDQQPNLSEFPAEEVDQMLAEVTPLSEDIALDDKISEQQSSPSNDISDDESDDFSKAVIVANKEIKPAGGANSGETKVNGTQSNESQQPVAVATNKSKAKETFQQPMWILQLGSFKHKENVTTLRQKLKEAGIETYTKPVQTKAGLLSKVYVGPVQDKKSLEKVQSEIQKLNGLVGKITRFDTRN